jgi:hypothetical protein
MEVNSGGDLNMEVNSGGKFQYGGEFHGAFKKKQGRPSTLLYTTTIVYSLRVSQKYPKLHAPKSITVLFSLLN